MHLPRRPFIASGAFALVGAAAFACTASLPMKGRPCPCEADWFCCSWVKPAGQCAATQDECPMDPSYEILKTCSKGIDLGYVAAGEDSADAATPVSVAVVGVALKALVPGETVTFDYGSSASITANGLVRDQGWVFGATASQALFFRVKNGTGEPLDVALNVHGPIDVRDGSGDLCATSGVAVALEDSFVAPVSGVYFIAPKPTLTVSGGVPALDVPSAATPGAILSIDEQ